MTTKLPCPKCGSELILDITYGYPSSEAFEDKSFLLVVVVLTMNHQHIIATVANMILEK